MHAHPTSSLARWQHDHRFGLDQRRGAETRTKLVVAITFVTMAVEIVAGWAFGSMALLADGLHMGSHALALGISALAYVWMRRRADDRTFAFGTGKISALAGYTGALLLLAPVAIMIWESFDKLIFPIPIAFGPALLVAVVGLAVNAICAAILTRGGHHDDHGHAHAHAHDHEHGHHEHETDHNLRSAILHVTADALTSFLAILALLGGYYLGWSWLDPLMGLVGAGVIIAWAVGLIRGSGQILLDRTAPTEIRRKLCQAIEGRSDNRIVDLHVWSIGPGLYSAALSLVTHHPQPPDHYKTLVPLDLGIRHLTIEVHRCPEAGDATSVSAY